MVVKLKKVRRDANRVPVANDPVFEFSLLDNERIVGVAHAWESGGRALRSTADHHIIAWVEERN